MKRQLIRAELLVQHADLRRRIQETRVLVQHWVHGEATRTEVRNWLIALSVALQDHNHNEERLLGGIIPAIDELGAPRASEMTDRHVEEHHELYGALVVASDSPAAETAATLLELLFGRVLDHMAHEEAAFLGRDVQR